MGQLVGVEQASPGLKLGSVMWNPVAVAQEATEAGRVLAAPGRRALVLAGCGGLWKWPVPTCQGTRDRGTENSPREKS